MSDASCSTDGCNGHHYAKGKCRPCYDRAKRASRPRKPRSTPEQRFWAKVSPGDPDECWLWRGSVNSEGYGRIRINRVHYAAHRLAYELLVGPIPEGLHIDHLCRVRSCVNPSHMEPVPCRINVLRGVGVAAQNSRKAFCPRGHVYDALWAKNYRHCRRCQYQSSRRWATRQDVQARRRAKDRERMLATA
jgi:hypothetical protein